MRVGHLFLHRASGGIEISRHDDAPGWALRRGRGCRALLALSKSSKALHLLEDARRAPSRPIVFIVFILFLFARRLVVAPAVDGVAIRDEEGDARRRHQFRLVGAGMGWVGVEWGGVGGVGLLLLPPAWK